MTMDCRIGSSASLCGEGIIPSRLQVTVNHYIICNEEVLIFDERDAAWPDLKLRPIADCGQREVAWRVVLLVLLGVVI